jgi:predicted nucleic acid-binding protein
MVLADSNILLDVITENPDWGAWAQNALNQWGQRGPLLINPVIYAELAPEYAAIEALDAAIADVGLEFREIPKAALFLAAKAHVLYRRRGGTRVGVLADFLVGAHAAILGIPLLTRDPWRVHGYFPSVRLITP